ncbi:hypothetical protein TSUD_142030 [Trifolium subterraneum]|uniref:Reverse transcriptase domain-containing protein n=1 Tax=Trifolium subterraneum TaxID=3900 RepID=A0A2Z6LJV9_TRISU|nr:hypothetical protein TSUD_142030 [Trifolium subterraneum]
MVPQMGEDEGEWTEERPRRRKAPERADGGPDRWRSVSRHRETESLISRHDHWSSVSRDAGYRCTRSRSPCFHHHEGGFRFTENAHQYPRMNQVHEASRIHHERSCLNHSICRKSNLSLSGREKKNTNPSRHSNEDVNIQKAGFSDMVVPFIRGAVQNVHGEKEGLGSAFKRYVSFYFTNFSDLRKGFEVCGILEDVYVAKKRNYRGDAFGFVKFENVKDVNKLWKALNDVWFGYFRVRARLVRFDRKDTKETKKARLELEGATKVRTRDFSSGKEINGEIRKGGENIIVTQETLAKGGKAALVGMGQPFTSEGIRGSMPKHQLQKFMCVYRIGQDDMNWACNGVVATVTKGEAIPVVQQRVADAGFNDLEIIPMGADKVFVRSLVETDVATVFEGAKDFFKLIFSNWARWDKELAPTRRGGLGALVRYLRANSYTVGKIRFDYARVLISTPALEDACLLEEGRISEATHSDGEEEHGDLEASNNVDVLLKRYMEEEGEWVSPTARKSINITTETVREDKLDSIEGDTQFSLTPPLSPHVGINNLSVCKENDNEDANLREVTSYPRGHTSGQHNPIERKRSESCPPGANRSMLSGSWSLEWLHDHNLGDARVIFSSKVGTKKGEQAAQGSEYHDRDEVLKILKKNALRRQDRSNSLRHNEEVGQVPHADNSSYTSITNDWEHWVVMHENEQRALEDVRGIWNTIGVQVNGVNANMFSALSRNRKGEQSGEEFFIANVYVPCDTAAKQTLWDSLFVQIQSMGRKRVCVCGDFNAVRCAEERRSSREGTRFLDIIPFNQFLDDNFLIDLPLSSRKFTWYKGDSSSMSLLDRFLLSEEWGLAWPNCLQVAQLRGLSDHCPLTLTVDEDNWGPRPSRMLKCWKDVPSICWQQSRSLWLKEGDANTKFFHSVLASRMRGNSISSLQVNGATTEGVHPIRQAVFTHFASHFKANNVDRSGVENLHFRQLNPLERGRLTIPFSLEEVKTAVWDCDSYKSPGPDGINFGFIKDLWTEMQGDIMRFMAEFHRNGKLTKGLNATFIALIPKVDSPQCLNDFRPISLVGSLCKIMAKVLANRLREVISSVISESQTAFVKDRRIVNGILIANEVVDEARKSQKELLLFKVDFEKVYDSIDWGYLDAVMGRMPFPVLWRKWIKECVCTATASVLVNGSPTDEFPLERGLRQGDPLSPFLFLLAAEGLHVLMQAMVENNLFTAYTIGMQDPLAVSHLQFANDTLLLGVKRVNIPDSWLNDVAPVLRCRVGKVPFLYLGLPIGGNPLRLIFLAPVVTRIKKRLSRWKSRFLSFGGRLILLKSVLTSLPVYALSFFKAPSDRGGLWYHVLVARYGEVRGRLCEGEEGVYVMAGDCENSLGSRGPQRRVVWGLCLETVEYSSRYVILRVGSWGGVGVAETAVGIDGLDDRYTVRGAYQLLTAQDVVSLGDTTCLIWHTQVPLKVSILACRLLRDRLPTKANLSSRGIIPA